MSSLQMNGVPSASKKFIKASTKKLAPQLGESSWLCESSQANKGLRGGPSSACTMRDHLRFLATSRKTRSHHGRATGSSDIQSLENVHARSWKAKTPPSKCGETVHRANSAKIKWRTLNALIHVIILSILFTCCSAATQKQKEPQGSPRTPGKNLSVSSLLAKMFIGALMFGQASGDSATCGPGEASYMEYNDHGEPARVCEAGSFQKRFSDIGESRRVEVINNEIADGYAIWIKNVFDKEDIQRIKSAIATFPNPQMGDGKANRHNPSQINVTVQTEGNGQGPKGIAFRKAMRDNPGIKRAQTMMEISLSEFSGYPVTLGEDYKDTRYDHIHYEPKHGDPTRPIGTHTDRQEYTKFFGNELVFVMHVGLSTPGVNFVEGTGEFSLTVDQNTERGLRGGPSNMRIAPNDTDFVAHFIDVPHQVQGTSFPAKQEPTTSDEAPKRERQAISELKKVRIKSGVTVHEHIANLRVKLNKLLTERREARLARQKEARNPKRSRTQGQAKRYRNRADKRQTEKRLAEEAKSERKRKQAPSPGDVRRKAHEEALKRKLRKQWKHNRPVHELNQTIGEMERHGFTCPADLKPNDAH